MLLFLSNHAIVVAAALFLVLSPLAPVDGIPRAAMANLLMKRQAGGPSAAAACPKGSPVCVAARLQSYIYRSNKNRSTSRQTRRKMFS
jgi:hypothetical protein